MRCIIRAGEWSRGWRSELDHALLQLKDGASSDRTISALSPYLNGFLSLADVASSTLVPCCDSARATGLGTVVQLLPGVLSRCLREWMRLGGWMGVTLLSQCPTAVQTLPFLISLPFFILH